MEPSPPVSTSKRKAFKNFVKRGVGWPRDTISIPRPLSSHSRASAPPESKVSPDSSDTVEPPPYSAAQSGSNNSLNTPPLCVSTIAPISPESHALISDKVKEASSVAWNGLKTGLQVLDNISDVFPPLKSAVSILLACLDVVETAAGNRDDYEALSAELIIIANSLSQHVSNLAASESGGGSVAYILQSIKEEAIHIGKQKAHGKGRKIIESPQDREDVLKRYRRIESLFRQLQNDISLRTWDTTRKIHEISLLQGMSTVDAAGYNSSYSTTIKRRACTAETREKTQKDLEEWVRDPNGAKVYWINGMAGTGKTTILYSLCKWLEENRGLGGNFFCSRILDLCRNPNNIIPTLAYQLAHYSSAFRTALCKFLDKEPGAGKRDISYQFKKLILEPMKEVEDAIPEGVVVVVDALDECDDSSVIRRFLGLLIDHASNLPIKFIVTSRPEPAIRDRMTAPGFMPSVLHLHDIEESIVEADIIKYLAEELRAMEPPPTPDQVQQLAKRAGKLFIYAATVIRYIQPDSIMVDSGRRLKTVLKTVSSLESSKQYKDLDTLYTGILSSAFNDDLEEWEAHEIFLVLRTVVCAKEPMLVQTLALLLGLEESRIRLSLEPLRSVLHVQDGVGPVSALHASFPDYIFDSVRSGKKFYCDRTQHSQIIAGGCFDVMKSQLRFNICNLESSFLFDKDVVDLDDRLKTCISRELSYACRYWGNHLREGNLTDEAHDKLVDFLTYRLLFWMEVLNLEGRMVVGVEMLWLIQNWLENSRIVTRMQVADAEAFVRRYTAGTCTQSTPHIYISGLPFCSRSSSVYKNYHGRARGLIYVKGSASEQWSLDATIALWRTDSKSYIKTMALSPNGTQIVLGSNDKTIEVWDAHTGAIVIGPFTGHADLITSVAFSPNGTRFASGSQDSTIRVWDARTGDPVAGPFTGHTSYINSVAFSPEGTRIVSGAFDDTIRVWDACTGDTVAGPFTGHTKAVMSVAFSPDSTRIVSGSKDKTIRVWDARTGNTVAGPFMGHTSDINSVAFSPDGTRIVSGSWDATIRVWDARTGDTVAGPFTGHTTSVKSVSFSPDGTRIISGSEDHTIRVWDACTGNTVAGPYTEHIGRVISVAFFPDGTRIVSGSEDCTIRVWDARVDDTIAVKTTGHTKLIMSVAFSPDGARIVSGSFDYTIRVWDARTGNAVAGPFTGHTGNIYSVSFSPDGTHIVSGSEDGTIRVWDACNGSTIAGLFIGHTRGISSVAFSPDGNHIVSGSLDHTVRVWDAHIGNAIAGPFIGHTFHVMSVAFSPDGTRIVSGSSDRTIRVWDVFTGNLNTIVGPFIGHTEHISSVVFSPDGTHIVSGSYDGTIRFWDACTGNTAAGPFIGRTGGVASVAFSPDGTHIASGSVDSTIRLWDVRTGKTIIAEHSSVVRSVAFSPDGTRIISGSDDGCIRVWDTRASNAQSRFTNIPLNSSDVSPDYVEDFKFQKDGWITSNGVLLFWVSPHLLAQVPHPRNTVVIGPRGTSFVDYYNLNIGDKWSRCFV